RRREFFDRVLDARDPGELVEHATLTEAALDRHKLGIDALFVVGDELFGYLFRPENGWGSGRADRKAIDYTPRLRRVHQGLAGGPRVEQARTTKGVSFGRIAAGPDGTLDYGAVEGVDPDLTMRPFGWKGHQATLRGMVEESLHLHQGLVSNRIQFAVRDGTLD